MQVLSVIRKIIEEENLDDAHNSSFVNCNNELEDALKTKSFQMKELRQVSFKSVERNAYVVYSHLTILFTYRNVVLSQLNVMFIIPNKGSDCLSSDIKFSLTLSHLLFKRIWCPLK